MNTERDLQARLFEVRSELQRTIIGQQAAIDSIMGTLERFHAGLHDDQRPIGSFLFIGPSGCGKTFCVQKIAELVQTPDAFIRIDCSEFQLEHEVAKLLGSPPGYVGHESGSILTKQIGNIQNPEKGFILLLDEIEKANHRFFDTWLQVFDNGVMTDSKGKKLDFSRALIFMTSNIGAANYNFKGIGFREGNINLQNVESIISKEIKKTFKPEFINRFSGTVFFNPLTREQQNTILTNMFADLNKRLSRHYVKLILSDEARNHLITVGFSIEYGARELKRKLINLVEQPLATKLISKAIVPDSIIELCFNNQDGLYFNYVSEYPILQEDSDTYLAN